MKTAVVLFNLGGPDSPEAVRPFLQNLFSDPAIIGAPAAIRLPLAWWIARKRAPLARKIYQHLGGESPLLPNTQSQASALEQVLNEEALHEKGGDNHKVFIAMRYWHPRAEETVRAVLHWGADRVVLLPLYPQYSTTTSGSSLAEWGACARKLGLEVATSAVCCFPTNQGFVQAVMRAIKTSLEGLEAGTSFRVLFSAHGLPEKIIAGGDPYQWQVERSAAAVVSALDDDTLDWQVCYQSRVGPLQWIGPSTEAEIKRAGAEGKAVIVVPIAFVSEHSETLVELDIEYRELAQQAGVPSYIRTPTVMAEAAFIEGLAALVRGAKSSEGTHPEGQSRICPKSWARCALSQEGLGR